MPKGLNPSDELLVLHLQHRILDDFEKEDTNTWSTLAPESGTSTVGDSAGGVVALAASDATIADNDEIYFYTKEVYLFAAGKPLKMYSRVQYTEGNTDDANIYVGLASGVAANFMQDNGLGPAASFSGVGFYKVDGGLNWNVIFSVGSTQTKAELTAVASFNRTAQVAGGAAYQNLEIEVVPTTSTLCDVYFSINGSLVYKMNDQVYTGATEMSAVYCSKTGGTAANETLNVDAHYSVQKR